jgi:ABC-type transport system substrate-binding protein
VNVKNSKITIVLCGVWLFFLASYSLAFAKSDNVLVIAEPSKLAPINPLFTNSTISANLLDLIYDPIIDFGSKGEIKPALAKRWKVSPDGLEWTFELNEGVKFHDGTLLTAKDIKATYDAVIATKRNFYSFGFSNVESIDAVSDFMIRIKLKRYDAFLPFFLRHIYITPSAIIESKAEEMPVIGTGSFRLGYYSEQRIELLANERHYGGGPSLDKIVVDIYPNQRTCLTKLIAGAADLIFLVDVVDYDIFSDVGDIELYAPVVEFNYWVVFNLRNPLLANKHVRKAMNYAVDRDRVAKTGGGGYTVLSSIKGNYKKSALDFNFSHDPRKALEVIRSGGLRGKGRLSFNLSLARSDDVSKRVARFMQDDFESIGIDLQLYDIPLFKELAVKGRTERKFDLMLMPSNMRAGMPLNYILWHSSQINGGGNLGGYSNAEVDRLLDEIRHNPDPLKRNESERKLAEVLHDDPPVIPLFVRGVPVLVNKRFTGFSSDSFSFFSSLRNVRIKED